MLISSLKSRLQKFKTVFLLVGVGLLVYFSILFNGFIWDDLIYFANDSAFHSLKNSYLYFLGIHANVGEGINTAIYYRPLISVYFATIHSFFGPTPFFFHFSQLLIHITNSIFTLYILRNFFKEDSNLPAFLSLIFLIHPVNVEAVAWIAATQEILFVTFGLSALLLIQSSKTKSSRTIIAASTLIFLGLLIKESAILFFSLTFFYLLLFSKKNAALTQVFTSAIFSTLYFLLRFFTKSFSLDTTSLSAIMNASLVERFLTMPKIFSFYLTNLVFPKNLAISQHWVVRTADFIDFTFPLLVSILFLILCLIYVLRSRNKLFLFFFIWFILGIGLHLQIIPLSMTVAERWLYFPLIGALGMVGSIIQRIKLKEAHYLNISLILIIFLFVLRSFFRLMDWRTPLSLYSHDIKISKESYDLENNLGIELFKIGKIDEAGEHFKKATNLNPSRPGAWNNLGSYYALKGNFTQAEETYKNALKAGRRSSTYNKYASLLIKQKKYTAAKKLLEEGLKYYPENKKLQEKYRQVIEIFKPGS